MAEGRAPRRYLVVLILATVAVYLVNTNASPLGDSAAAVPIATSIVGDGDILLDEYRDAPGFASGGWVEADDQGALVGYFPWAVGLAALPVVLVIDAAGLIGIGSGAFDLVAPMGRAHAVVQSVAASLWTALAVAGVYVLARRRAGARSPWFALAVAAVFALGTSAWSTAASQLWQHGPSLACVTWALVLAHDLVGRGATDGGATRSAAALGALAMAAGAVRPTNVLLVGGVAVLVAARCRTRLVALGVGAVAVAVPWLLITKAAYGSWLQPYAGSDRIGIHDAYLEALAANLVSTGRGLLVFSPVAVVGVVGGWRVARRPRSADPLELLSLGILVAHWLVIAGLPHWTGGYSFGPRLFTDALPYLVVLALPVARDLPAWRRGRPPAVATAAVVALAVLSVAIHAQSTLVISTRCWNTTPIDVDADYRRVWSISDPMVTAGYRDLVRDPGASIRGRCTRGGSGPVR